MDEVECAEGERWLHSFDAAGLRYDEILPAFVNASRKHIEETKKAIEETRKAIEEAKRRRRGVIQALSASLAALIVSLLFIANQSIHSKFNQLNAFNESSCYLFAENSNLDALVESVRAGQLQANINGWQRHVPGFNLIFTQATEIRIKTIGALQQAVYGTHEHNRLEGHSEKVNSVSYHPKGHMLASGGDDGIRFWKSDGEPIEKPIDAHERVTSVAFSPDGTTMASTLADGTVQLWDPAHYMLRKTWKGHEGGPREGWINAASFSPTGEVLATASRDKTIKLWNVADGTLVKELKGHEDGVNAVSFSPDGETLASAGEDGTVRRWNVKEGAPIDAPREKGRVTSLMFSPDGRFLASAHNDADEHYIMLRYMETGEHLPFRGAHPKPITSVRFSPDSRFLASASEDNTLRIWRRTDSGWALLTTLRGHLDPVLSADWSPDGRMLASSGADKTVRLWRTPMLGALVDMEIQHAALSPDGRTLAVSGFTPSGNVTQFCQRDKVTSRLSCKPPHSHDFNVAALSFSPDGLTLASGNEGDGIQSIQLWNTSDGVPINTLVHRFTKPLTS